jgi:beta-N-acetylhexosaminidase
VRIAAALLAGVVFGGAACTSTVAGTGTHIPDASSSTPGAAAPTTPSAVTRPPRTPPSVVSPPSSATRVAEVLAAMDEARRVGQLFMVDADATAIDPRAVDAITGDHVAGVYLSGRTSLSVRQTAAVTAGLQRYAGQVQLFVSADQEGGEVQRFGGPGFSAIPSALEQGRLPPATLQARAEQWGAELASAGVNLNLAPVADTVPSAAAARDNPPIGGFDRQYGFDPHLVTTQVLAFAAGMRAAGVDATAKHFPGLGRVTANTDVSADVTDAQTTRTDPYLAPFAALVRRGIPFVMMSTAVYTRIDPTGPAAFSPTVVEGMLRGELGFTGVVVSDDLNAVQVRGVPAAQRAVEFIAAGGDLVLDLADADTGPMISAVLARTRSDPAFKAKVDAAAGRVLRAKQARGLLD